MGAATLTGQIERNFSMFDYIIAYFVDDLLNEADEILALVKTE